MPGLSSTIKSLMAFPASIRPSCIRNVGATGPAVNRDHHMSTGCGDLHSCVRFHTLSGWLVDLDLELGLVLERELEDGVVAVQSEFLTDARPVVLDRAVVN